MTPESNLPRAWPMSAFIGMSDCVSIMMEGSESGDEVLEDSVQHVHKRYVDLWVSLGLFHKVSAMLCQKVCSVGIAFSPYQSLVGQLLQAFQAGTELVLFVVFRGG
jgi:hypothetical protein